jgi:hypothetical protein
MTLFEVPRWVWIPTAWRHCFRIRIATCGRPRHVELIKLSQLGSVEAVHKMGSCAIRYEIGPANLTEVSLEIAVQPSAGGILVIADLTAPFGFRPVHLPYRWLQLLKERRKTFFGLTHTKVVLGWCCS